MQIHPYLWHMVGIKYREKFLLKVEEDAYKTNQSGTFASESKVMYFMFWCFIPDINQRVNSCFDTGKS